MNHDFGCSFNSNVISRELWKDQLFSVKRDPDPPPPLLLFFNRWSLHLFPWLLHVIQEWYHYSKEKLGAMIKIVYPVLAPFRDIVFYSIV